MRSRPICGSKANMKPTDIIRPEIGALSSYHVQPAAGFIKLDAMENPYAFPQSLPESLQARLLERLSTVSLNRYPAADAPELKASIRYAMQIPAELDIMLGNGSDEIIQLIAMAVAKPGAALLSVEPAFVMFKMIATFCGLHYIGVSLKADFSLDAEAMVAAIAREQPAVIFIANPNNPTGNCFDRKSIARIISTAEKNGGLVVIDEAYFPFTTHAHESYLHNITEHENVVLMRTVSKLGLAGLRLGMLVGRQAWLQEFDKLRLPYNINALTQAAAAFAMEQYGELLKQCDVIKHERIRLAIALANISGIETFPSEANFILIRVTGDTSVNTEADKMFAKLRSRKILVKNTSQSHPLLANTLRLTVGTPTENDAMIAALNENP